MEKSTIISDPKEKRKHRASIKFWVSKIKDEGLSAFTRSAQQLSEISDDNTADLAKISKLIMSDAGMTTKVLLASNSALRMRKGKVNTVSRALVMLGIGEVKRICLGCALIDGLLQDNPSEELLDEMTRCIHAATLSRLMALARGDPSTEEVFLFSLIKGIGALGFWKVGGSTVDALRDALASSDKKPEEVERDVLGFTLAELSVALMNEWQMQKYSLTENSSNPLESRRAKEVGFTEHLSKYISKGWEDPFVKELLGEMSESLAIDESTLHSTIVSAAIETNETLKVFGLSRTINQISLPSESTVQNEETNLEEVAFTARRPDPLLQLKILRELNSMVMEGGEVTLAIVRILEGMHKGVGLDRAVFAIRSEKHNTLTARLANGARNSWTLENFDFPIPQVSDDLFTYIAKKMKPVWYQRSSGELSNLITPRIQSVIGDGDFFVAPLIIAGKWIAIFYADRRESKRELDQDDFEAFMQFVFQGTVALSQHGDKF
jgi:HD-like signal output (HDOD) protein